MSIVCETLPACRTVLARPSLLRLKLGIKMPPVFRGLSSLLAGTRPHAIPLAGVSWCHQQATILHIRAYEARALPIEL